MPVILGVIIKDSYMTLLVAWWPVLHSRVAPFPSSLHLQQGSPCLIGKSSTPADSSDLHLYADLLLCGDSDAKICKVGLAKACTYAAKWLEPEPK